MSSCLNEIDPGKGSEVDSAVPVHLIVDKHASMVISTREEAIDLRKAEDNVSVSDYNAWIGDAYTSGIASPRSPRSFVTHQTSRGGTRTTETTRDSEVGRSTGGQITDEQQAYAELRPSISVAVTTPRGQLYRFI